MFQPSTKANHSIASGRQPKTLCHRVSVFDPLDGNNRNVLLDLKGDRNTCVENRYQVRVIWK